MSIRISKLTHTDESTDTKHMQGKPVLYKCHLLDIFLKILLGFVTKGTKIEFKYILLPLPRSTQLNLDIITRHSSE